MTTQPSRPDLLADLAAAVNELTRPRQHTEIIETATVVPAETTGRRRKARRTRRRTRHTVTLPSLLDSLRQAMVPGTTGDAVASGGFESRPSAELEPVAVLREIAADATTWARALEVDRATLAGAIRGLISANPTDEQLAHLVRDAERWVRRARMATGFDLPPVTLDAPCPYCFRKNALSITGDLQSAKCQRCGTSWSPDTIGLLADMLRANAEQETMVDARCVWPSCGIRGPHDRHSDGAGRLFFDRCDINERTTA